MDKTKLKLAVIGMALAHGSRTGIAETLGTTFSEDANSRAHPDSRRNPSDNAHAYNRNKKKR